MRSCEPIRLWLSLALSLSCLPTAGLAQSAFTYQGRLLASGQPANGIYDFQFSLSDANIGGNQIGPGLSRRGILVSNALFMTTLNFGADAFTGLNRWLEISVRTNGSGSNYSVLSPRQAVTAAPSAQFASRAGTAAWASNMFSGGAIAGNGAGLTNLNGASIVSGTLTSNQLSLATDAAYRATDTNAVRALGDARWSAKTVISVKDYGATGNGQNDDTVAISNAWTHFVTEGGTLYFPPGTYLDSATHICAGWRTGEPQYRDGRLILGQGSVIWRYTGSGTQFVLSNSVPDIEGIEFANGGNGINCMYLTGVWSKWSLRHCFFNGWMNANAGTVLLDDADSVTLDSVQFYQCSLGLGLGFHCGNFKGDLLFSHCGTCVAVGVPTPTYPGTQRDSKVVNLSLLTAYCGTAVAVDGGSGPITIQANNWYAANAILLGTIPGVSTNFSGYVGPITIEHSWFNNGSTLAPPIQVYSPVYPALEIRQTTFEASGSPVTMVKSRNVAADQTRINWLDAAVWGIAKGMFEDSTGGVLAESANDQTRFFNKGLGIYNARSLLNEGGAGYLLDVLDASFAGPIARFGLNAHTNNSFNEFWGGFTVGYDATLKRPSVQVTNADFIVTPPQTVLGPNDPGQVGTIRWDTNYIYVCVRSNLWKRAALSSW